MALDPSALPADVTALRALVMAQAAELTIRDAELAGSLAMVERLRVQLARLRRMRFGRSSEKLEAALAQLELALEDLETGMPPTRPDAVEGDRPAVAGKRTPLRRPLPEHLPREPVEHRTACACPRCGGGLRRLGEDVTEVLDWVPGSFKVTRHIRPKFSCRDCETITQAPAPSLPIRRGRAGPGLLAHVLVAKYADHLPLYRQAEIYAREGVELSRSTLASWVGQSATLLRPLVAALQRHVLAGDRLHADDTPVPVLAPGTGKTRTGRLWAYLRDERPHGGGAAPAVFYRYTPDRRGEHPRAHLAGFRGVLQADGYAGFNGLYDTGRIAEAACWAHVRRKFHDIHIAGASPLATDALRRIAALYAIERDIHGRPPAERASARQARAGPLLDDLHVWLAATLARIPGRGDLAAAIRYALARWQALIRYRDDGCLAIDNNPVERAIRPLALGRKNWLFAGADQGGEYAAAIASLIATAKLNGIDPEAYLRHVLTSIADHPASRVDEFLPWNIAGLKARLDQRKAA
jgi:transposase